MQLTHSLTVDDFILIEDSLPLISKSTGISIYDYSFRNFFNVQSVFYPPKKPVIARIGAIENYQQIYNELLSEEISLVHTPDEHDRCSFIHGWYPLIKDFTPYSVIFHTLPTVKIVENDFKWPIFVKGERQTNKHKKSLSVIENKEQFEQLLTHWQHDPVLHWQKMVCRQFIPLQLVDIPVGDHIQSSFEFRLFYWKQQLVSIGRYWHASNYTLSENEQKKVIELGNEVAKCISVCFLAIDLAKTTTGNWIVIEVNDGQESGYAGNNAYLLWQNIIKVEKSFT
jgi:hypothetical protein